VEATGAVIKGSGFFCTVVGARLTGDAEDVAVKIYSSAATRKPRSSVS
jgi:hypothetical protein